MAGLDVCYRQCFQEKTQARKHSQSAEPHKTHSQSHAHFLSDSRQVKGAVCRILTLLKHKNTIICLQIFKKHAKLTYLFT